MRKFCMAVRVATVAPVMATALCLYLYFSGAGLIYRGRDLAAALICLAAFPLLAYPLQPLIPGFRGRGRTGQRAPNASRARS